MGFCARRAVGSFLLLLLCVCAFSIVVAASLAENTPRDKYDDHTERHTYKVDAETSEALKSFRASGLNIVQLMNEIKTLRSRSVRLTQEILRLKDSLGKEKAKAKGQGTNEDGAPSAENKKRTWQAFICGESSKPEEKTIIVEGCQDAACCFHLGLHLFSEGAHQFLRSVQSAVLDVTGWVTGIHGGLWYTAFQWFFGFCIYQCLAWIVLHFDVVRERMTVALHRFCSLPGFRLWESVLELLEATKRRKVNREVRGGHELDELKAQVEKLMKKLEGTKKEREDSEPKEQHRETITETQHNSDALEAVEGEQNTKETDDEGEQNAREAEDEGEKTVDERDGDNSELSYSWTCPGSPSAVDEMIS